MVDLSDVDPLHFHIVHVGKYSGTSFICDLAKTDIETKGSAYSTGDPSMVTCIACRKILQEKIHSEEDRRLLGYG